MKCFIYNAYDGGVAICRPFEETIRWMGCGGYWNDRPRGYVETQIERQIADGRDADAAQRFARAIAFGGRTTAEALEIIRDRDCAHLGTAIELWDVDEVPTDRWFRDAWRRSHNGGPIMVDLVKAKPIQFGRARAFVECENKRRSVDLELFDEPIEVDWPRFRERVLCVREEIELRCVWPVELKHAGKITPNAV